MKNPYSELAAAVLDRAINDYINALRKEEDSETGRTFWSVLTKFEVMDFLYSEYGEVFFELAGINKQALIAYLENYKLPEEDCKDDKKRNDSKN